MGIFNWQDRAADRVLPVQADSHIVEFWTQAYRRAAAPVALPDLPPHSGRLFAVRPASAEPQFVGSSLHFSQGGEIAEWEGTGARLRFVINLDRKAEGAITLSLPAWMGAGRPGQSPVFLADGRATASELLADGVYRAAVAVNGTAEVIIE
jgi:hypothetical protein